MRTWFELPAVSSHQRFLSETVQLILQILQRENMILGADINLIQQLELGINKIVRSKRETIQDEEIQNLQELGLTVKRGD